MGLFISRGPQPGNKFLFLRSSPARAKKKNPKDAISMLRQAVSNSHSGTNHARSSLRLAAPSTRDTAYLEEDRWL